MPPKLVIVNYGVGNLNSVRKCVDRMGVGATISSEPKDIINSEKIIFPGVGHFGKAMSSLEELNLLDTLHEAVLVKRKPILGICLGMELMARGSEEGGARGLGWLDADVIKFNVSDKLKYKLPHMGWNQVRIKKESLLMDEIPDSSEFYFAHSYHLKVGDQSDILSETRYDYPFPSAVERGNIFGVQYHPEKSHGAGARLLRNFIEL